MSVLSPLLPASRHPSGLEGGHILSWCNPWEQCCPWKSGAGDDCRTIHAGNSRVPGTQFSSVAQSCLTLCDPMDCSMPGLSVHHQLPEFTQIHVHWVGDFIQPSHPLLFPSIFPQSRPLPSLFPSIRVFSKESVLRIRWPKDWSFRLSINPSNEGSGLISLGWLVVSLCSSRDSQESSPTPQFKNINSSGLSFLHSPTFTPIQD